MPDESTYPRGNTNANSVRSPAVVSFEGSGPGASARAACRERVLYAPSGSHFSYVSTSFSVSTLVSPAFRELTSRLFGHALVDLVALDRIALVVVDDDRPALAGVLHLAELRVLDPFVEAVIVGQRTGQRAFARPSTVRAAS